MVARLFSFSMYTRLGETVDRLGMAYNTTEGEAAGSARAQAQTAGSARDWLANYLLPRQAEIAVDKEESEVVREKKEAVDLNRVGEVMEPSVAVRSGEMVAAIEEKRQYVAMLERLLQARLEQSKEESLDFM